MWNFSQFRLQIPENRLTGRKKPFSIRKFQAKSVYLRF